MPLENPDIIKLQDYFKSQGFNLASDIYVRPSAPGILVSIPETAITTRTSATGTSKRKLHSLKIQIKTELGLDIDFIFVRDIQQQQMEAGLNALLHARFPRAYENAYLSCRTNQKYDVWLEPVAAQLDSALHAHAIASVTEYIQLLGVKLGEISLVGQENTSPAIAIILRETKRLAPVSAYELAAALQDARFLIPSTSWIESKLDTLRRKGLVIRLPDGAYALSEVGLQLVPYGKTRRSSDVERILALGRTRWH